MRQITVMSTSRRRKPITEAAMMMAKVVTDRPVLGVVTIDAVVLVVVMVVAGTVIKKFK